MKSLMAAAASAAVFGAAVPGLAAAQTAAAPTGFYANLGYADIHTSGQNLGAIGGRLGYRFNNWLGVEGELAGGVKSDNFSTTIGGVPVTGKTKLSDAEAGYVVGFLPLSPQWDLLGRIGYGHSKIKVEDVAVGGVAGSVSGLSASGSGDSWNYGLGAQWHWDGANGVRGDYTREEFTHGANGHADVWSIAFDHRF